MSLKAFHIVFVAASVLLMLGIAAWCFQGWRQDGETMGLVWAGVSLASAVGLVAYGRYVLKKLRHISYL
jgi:hypothetical protein